MDKTYRKQIEQQLALTIAYFLRKTDEKAASSMAKPIKSAAKDLAKKFTKLKGEAQENKNGAPAVADKKMSSAKTETKASSTVKKKTVRPAAVKKKAVKKTTAAKKATAVKK